MDELQSVRDFAGPATLPSPEELAPGRDRLVAAFESPPRRSRRLLWAGATAVGLAAAITGVLALAPAEVGPPVAHADPVVVLREAAAAARQEPAADPRPDQFVYTRTQTSEGVREVWLSTDGTHDGLIQNPGEPGIPSPGCRNGKRAVEKGNEPVPGQFDECEPAPAYFADMPETVDGVLDWLGRNHSGGERDVNALGKDIVSLLNEYYLRPASRAALLEAATRIPGLKAVPDAKDAAGRTGTGITWDRSSTTFVFDQESHVLLGHTGSAVLDRGIVDQVGQVP
ncbi:CU044_5270 family protein [Amycolatopsis sp. 195334CR]|uniref:CU044_5270 family protein n=1 Tax=Amycolatopsis sp. 195334CR TaxID=2814588 RepID=UPI001A903ADB|nr:CU044_5270 family protein [Amycolatopsis sp. 195334CR]MBN6038037.1 CU044_5270 family protein [Amycolatopsis sp. 195334CR]